MLSINDDIIDISHARLELSGLILCLLELIFSVVLFDSFSCLEKSLCDHSYQSSDLSSIVYENFKILTLPTALELEKMKMNKVIFFFALLDFFLDFHH